MTISDITIHPKSRQRNTSWQDHNITTHKTKSIQQTDIRKSNKVKVESDSERLEKCRNDHNTLNYKTHTYTWYAYKTETVVVAGSD